MGVLFLHSGAAHDRSFRNTFLDEMAALADGLLNEELIRAVLNYDSMYVDSEPSGKKPITKDSCMFKVVDKFLTEDNLRILAGIVASDPRIVGDGDIGSISFYQFFRGVEELLNGNPEDFPEDLFHSDGPLMSIFTA